MGFQDEGDDSAFIFTGNWREFAPIAFTNLLLTIVTLGTYRFWAKTRERRYLWSHTLLLGDPIEWTGTGKELLIGFLFAVVMFGIPLFGLQFLAQALFLRGELGLANMLGLLSSLTLFYIIGFGRFRALRYRLSRTYWHGIRGGSDERGFLYGWSYVWKSIVGGFFFGLLLPWSMCDLWNQRWNSMSFGPHNFASGADSGPVLKRLLWCYGALILFLILFGVLAVSSRSILPSAALSAVVGLVLWFFLIVPAMIVLVAAYFAVFFQQAIGNLTLNRLEFSFDARMGDYIRLLLGDLGILIVTLGLGYVFLGYRHWRFLIDHLGASGEVSLSEMSQSLTATPKQGEGLLDAFDIGAF